MSIQTKITLLHHYNNSGKAQTVIISADKDSYTVILNKNGHVCKVDEMVEDGTAEVKYIETTDNTLCNINDSNIFFTVIFINKEIMKQCVRVLISLAVFSLQPKLARVNLLNIFFWTVSSYVLCLIKQGLVFKMVQKSFKNNSIL